MDRYSRQILLPPASAIAISAVRFMDLICHPYSQKLLILMAVDSVSDNAIEHAEYILEKFLKDTKKFKVVKLIGSGNEEKEKEDKKIILDALKYLKDNN